MADAAVPRPRPGRATADRLLLISSFAAVYLIWGSTYLAIAWGLATIPPLTMIAARSLIAGGVLYAVARRSAGAPTPSEWRRALVAGVLLFVTGQALLAVGQTRVASGAAALLVATEPLFVALLGWILGRTGRPSGWTLGAVVVGFGGVALMLLPGESGGIDAAGAAIILVGALSWSLGMFVAMPGAGRSVLQAAAMQLLAGGMVLTVVAIGTGDLAALDPGAVSTRSLLSFVYLVVFGSLVTYSAYVWLLRRVGPGRLSSHGYVNPMVAVVLGSAVGDEPITVAVVLSGIVILASVVVLVRAK